MFELFCRHFMPYWPYSWFQFQVTFATRAYMRFGKLMYPNTRVSCCEWALIVRSLGMITQKPAAVSPVAWAWYTQRWWASDCTTLNTSVNSEGANKCKYSRHSKGTEHFPPLLIIQDLLHKWVISSPSALLLACNAIGAFKRNCRWKSITLRNRVLVWAQAQCQIIDKTSQIKTQINCMNTKHLCDNSISLKACLAQL